VTVAAGSIVKDFDVIKDVGACELARFVDPLAYAFLLQAAEERLGDGVDAPMSSLANGIRQIRQDQRVQLANDVTLKATLNLFGGQSLSSSACDVRARRGSLRTRTIEIFHSALLAVRRLRD
jgi:hypothetical protein